MITPNELNEKINEIESLKKRQGDDLLISECAKIGLDISYSDIKGTCVTIGDYKISLTEEISFLSQLGFKTSKPKQWILIYTSFRLNGWFYLTSITQLLQ
jgi:hypothetical protein